PRSHTVADLRCAVSCHHVRGDSGTSVAESANLPARAAKLSQRQQLNTRQSCRQNSRRSRRCGMPLRASESNAADRSDFTDEIIFPSCRVFCILFIFSRLPKVV